MRPSDGMENDAVEKIRSKTAKTPSQHNIKALDILSKNV
jgi:hypothetical protein